MSFGADIEALGLGDLLEIARDAGDVAVDRALAADRPDLHDFAALLSPAAGRRLEELATRSRALTTRRFGRTIQLYAPFYVSNECVESCTYCSFARENPIRRRTLTVDEAVAEARLLVDRGFRHLLLVSGEHPRHASAAYMSEILRGLRDIVPSLSMEVQPVPVDVYRQWVADGAEGLVVYQETYDREAYARVHPVGKKKDYDWRLDTPDRAAAGGMKRIGIGALLGLADWRLESIHLAAHARYLMRRWWRCFVTVSFPRLRRAAHAITAPHPVADAELAQIVCAFRILEPDLGIILSTRESPEFRDGMLALGITQMSAGSRTEPGGYSAPGDTEMQFEIEDSRSAAEVARAIRARGLDPVWKDWEMTLNG